MVNEKGKACKDFEYTEQALLDTSTFQPRCNRVEEMGCCLTSGLREAFSEADQAAYTSMLIGFCGEKVNTKPCAEPPAPPCIGPDYTDHIYCPKADKSKLIQGNIDPILYDDLPAYDDWPEKWMHYKTPDDASCYRNQNRTMCFRRCTDLKGPQKCAAAQPSVCEFAQETIGVPDEYICQVKRCATCGDDEHCCRFLSDFRQREEFRSACLYAHGQCHDVIGPESKERGTTETALGSAGLSTTSTITNLRGAAVQGITGNVSTVQLGDPGVTPAWIGDKTALHKLSLTDCTTNLDIELVPVSRSVDIGLDRLELGCDSATPQTLVTDGGQGRDVVKRIVIRHPLEVVTAVKLSAGAVLELYAPLRTPSQIDVGPGALLRIMPGGGIVDTRLRRPTSTRYWDHWQMDTGGAKVSISGDVEVYGGRIRGKQLQLQRVNDVAGRMVFTNGSSTFCPIQTRTTLLTGHHPDCGPSKLPPRFDITCAHCERLGTLHAERISIVVASNASLAFTSPGQAIVSHVNATQGWLNPFDPALVTHGSENSITVSGVLVVGSASGGEVLDSAEDALRDPVVISASLTIAQGALLVDRAWLHVTGGLAMSAGPESNGARGRVQVHRDAVFTVDGVGTSSSAAGSETFVPSLTGTKAPDQTPGISIGSGYDSVTDVLALDPILSNCIINDGVFAVVGGTMKLDTSLVNRGAMWLAPQANLTLSSNRAWASGSGSSKVTVLANRLRFMPPQADGNGARGLMGHLRRMWEALRPHSGLVARLSLASKPSTSEMKTAVPAVVGIASTETLGGYWRAVATLTNEARMCCAYIRDAQITVPGAPQCSIVETTNVDTTLSASDWLALHEVLKASPVVQEALEDAFGAPAASETVIPKCASMRVVQRAVVQLGGSPLFSNTGSWSATTDPYVIAAAQALAVTVGSAEETITGLAGAALDMYDSHRSTAAINPPQWVLVDGQLEISTTRTPSAPDVDSEIDFVSADPSSFDLAGYGTVAIVRTHLTWIDSGSTVKPTFNLYRPPTETLAVARPRLGVSFECSRSKTNEEIRPLVLQAIHTDGFYWQDECGVTLEVANTMRVGYRMMVETELALKVPALEVLNGGLLSMKASLKLSGAASSNALLHMAAAGSRIVNKGSASLQFPQSGLVRFGWPAPAGGKPIVGSAWSACLLAADVRDGSVSVEDGHWLELAASLNTETTQKQELSASASAAVIVRRRMEATATPVMDTIAAGAKVESKLRGALLVLPSTRFKMVGSAGISGPVHVMGNAEMWFGCEATGSCDPTSATATPGTEAANTLLRTVSQQYREIVTAQTDSPWPDGAWPEAQDVWWAAKRLEANSKARTLEELNSMGAAKELRGALGHFCVLLCRLRATSANAAASKCGESPLSRVITPMIEQLPFTTSGSDDQLEMCGAVGAVEAIATAVLGRSDVMARTRPMSDMRHDLQHVHAHLAALQPSRAAAMSINPFSDSISVRQLALGVLQYRNVIGTISGLHEATLPPTAIPGWRVEGLLSVQRGAKLTFTGSHRLMLAGNLEVAELGTLDASGASMQVDTALAGAFAPRPEASQWQITGTMKLTAPSSSQSPPVSPDEWIRYPQLSLQRVAVGDENANFMGRLSMRGAFSLADRLKIRGTSKVDISAGLGALLTPTNVSVEVAESAISKNASFISLQGGGGFALLDAGASVGSYVLYPPAGSSGTTPTPSETAATTLALYAETTNQTTHAQLCGNSAVVVDTVVAGSLRDAAMQLGGVGAQSWEAAQRRRQYAPINGGQWRIGTSQAHGGKLQVRNGTLEVMRTFVSRVMPGVCASPSAMSGDHPAAGVPSHFDWHVNRGGLLWLVGWPMNLTSSRQDMSMYMGTTGSAMVEGVLATSGHVTIQAMPMHVTGVLTTDAASTVVVKSNHTWVDPSDTPLGAVRNMTASWLWQLRNRAVFQQAAVAPLRTSLVPELTPSTANVLVNRITAAFASLDSPAHGVHLRAAAATGDGLRHVANATDRGAMLLEQVYRCVQHAALRQGGSAANLRAHLPELLQISRRDEFVTVLGQRYSTKATAAWFGQCADQTWMDALARSLTPDRHPIDLGMPHTSPDGPLLSSQYGAVVSALRAVVTSIPTANDAMSSPALAKLRVLLESAASPTTSSMVSMARLWQEYRTSFAAVRIPGTLRLVEGAVFEVHDKSSRGGVSRGAAIRAHQLTGAISRVEALLGSTLRVSGSASVSTGEDVGSVGSAVAVNIARHNFVLANAEGFIAVGCAMGSTDTSATSSDQVVPDSVALGATIHVTDEGLWFVDSLAGYPTVRVEKAGSVHAVAPRVPCRSRLHDGRYCGLHVRDLDIRTTGEQPGLRIHNGVTAYLTVGDSMSMGLGWRVGRGSTGSEEYKPSGRVACGSIGSPQSIHIASSSALVVDERCTLVLEGETVSPASESSSARQRQLQEAGTSAMDPKDTWLSTPTVSVGAVLSRPVVLIDGALILSDTAQVRAGPNTVRVNGRIVVAGSAALTLSANDDTEVDPGLVTGAEAISQSLQISSDVSLTKLHAAQLAMAQAVVAEEVGRASVREYLRASGWWQESSTKLESAMCFSRGHLYSMSRYFMGSRSSSSSDTMEGQMAAVAEAVTVDAHVRRSHGASLQLFRGPTSDKDKFTTSVKNALGSVKTTAAAPTKVSAQNDAFDVAYVAMHSAYLESIAGPGVKSAALDVVVANMERLLLSNTTQSTWHTRAADPIGDTGAGVLFSDDETWSLLPSRTKRLLRNSDACQVSGQEESSRLIRLLCGWMRKWVYMQWSQQVMSPLMLTNRGRVEVRNGVLLHLVRRAYIVDQAKLHVSAGARLHVDNLHAPYLLPDVGLHLDNMLVVDPSVPASSALPARPLSGVEIRGLVTGSGFLDGNFTEAFANSVVSPGSSPGTLVLMGHVHMQDSTLQLEYGSRGKGNQDIMGVAGILHVEGGKLRALGIGNASVSADGTTKVLTDPCVQLIAPVDGMPESFKRDSMGLMPPMGPYPGTLPEAPVEDASSSAVKELAAEKAASCAFQRHNLARVMPGSGDAFGAMTGRFESAEVSGTLTDRVTADGAVAVVLPGGDEGGAQLPIPMIAAVAGVAVLLAVAAYGMVKKQKNQKKRAQREREQAIQAANTNPMHRSPDGKPLPRARKWSVVQAHTVMTPMGDLKTGAAIPAEPTGVNFGFGMPMKQENPMALLAESANPFFKGRSARFAPTPQQSGRKAADKSALL